MDLIKPLVKKKILNRKQASALEAEIKESGKSQEEIILEKKIVSETELFEMKSKLLKIPFKKVLPEIIPPDVLSVIPKESVEFYKMVPLALKKKERVVEVGMIYPENPQAQQALKFLTRQQKLSLRIFLVTLSDFKKYIEKYQAPEEEMERALEKLEIEMGKEGVAERDELLREPEKFGRLVEEAPVIKMVAVILRQAVEKRASDIHIEPGRDDLRVRFRVDGILHASLLLPLKIHLAVVARIKILSRLRIDETRIPQDGRFSTRIGGKRIDFRVSTFPTTLGEKVAVRVLDPKEGLKSFEELGLRDRNLELVGKAIRQPSGMILVCGPTSSGKTTTLYAIMRALNRIKVNIVTLEDPVEYFIEGLNQSQVRPEIDYTFARGLRQILRQDPDIIMVGEVRDEETAALAVHAALTGHLVLSTLHTGNVLGVVPRLIDMDVKPFLLPTTLSLAISQRLVRILCPFCKEKVQAQEKAKKYILEKAKGKVEEPIFIFRAKGCKKCNSSGYTGRTGIFEALKMTDNLARVIIQKPEEGEILKEAKAQGIVSIMEDGIAKVLEGVTSLEEIMRVAEER